MQPSIKSLLQLLCLGAALLTLRLTAAPAILFQMDQAPVTGSLKITNSASSNTAYWGSLAGSGALPYLTNGATAYTGGAWQFTGGYYLGVGPNAVTERLGDITNTPGMSVAFWVNYSSSSSFVRVCGLGGSGETFDFSTQNGGKIMFCVGYQPNGTRWVSMVPGQMVFDGHWHQVVGTVDFRSTVNNAVVYLDGVAVLTNSATFYHSITSTGSLNIGARGNGSPTACAIDQFIVYTNALQPAEVAELYATGTVTNYTPVVRVSAAQQNLVIPTGASSVATTLTAAITDDGLPNPPGHVTNFWSQTSGPSGAYAAFSAPMATSTSVTFSNTGVYVLRCTAGDGALNDFDEVTVQVFTNSAPIVAAWAMPAILLDTNPTVIALNGLVLDDGLPNPPGAVTSQWTCVSSPGNVGVTFGNAASVNTTATIPVTPGTYLLRLTASDSLLTGIADVTVTVTNDFPPQLTAWAAQPILLWPSNSVALQAQISDDGRPNPPGVVTSLWSAVSGPGTVAFADAAATNTTATFSTPGVYELQLAASDGQVAVTNPVWINIWSNSVGVNPPDSVRVLSATPLPYVHPRIFFTDADRSDLQLRAANDPVVHDAIYGPNGLTNIVATTVDNPSNPFGAAFVRLAAGETSVDISALATNGVAVANVCMVGSGGLYEDIASACYLAWLYPTNLTRLQQLATAVATAATIENGWYVSNPSDELDADVNADLGFCYDLMYDWMSDLQRSATRNLISRMTTGRHTIGWNQADYTDSTNWRVHHDHLLIAQLAIEGETGYDSVALATNAASLKTFTTRWGVSQDGFGREGTDYYSFGMKNGALAALALARRGENLFVTSHLYSGQQEAFYMMAPWGVSQFGHDDGAGWGNSSTGIGIYFRLMRYMYPSDELADCVLRNFNASASADNTPLATAIFGLAPLSGNTNFAVTAAARDLQLVKFDPQRGIGTVRSDWSTNAAQLDFDCRFDCMSLGHMHSDRNNFDFWADGRTWIGDPGYHVTENDAHSTILIDGVGEAGTATTTTTSYMHWPSVPGHFLAFSNQPVVTQFAGDAAPAYDYSWDWSTLGDGNGYNPLTSYVSTGVATPWRWVDLMYAPPADLTGANAWMTNYVRAEATMFNPVVKAFRTTLMLRGTDPYALIVDDIQKDNRPHTYDWSANTIGVDPNGTFADPVTDVAFVGTPDATNAVLWHTNDTGAFQPRLLVRVLQGNGTAAPIQIMDETDTQGTHLRRLVISHSNVVAPDFKIMLFPYLAGASMPTTIWSNNLLTVAMPDGQLDHIYFNTNADGRTRVTVYRLAGVGAVPAIPTNLTATAGNAQAALTWSPVSGADSYNVRVSGDGGATYTLVSTNVTTTAFTVNGLVNGASYDFEVAAVNPNGESERSAPVSATPLSPPGAAPVWTGASAGDGLVTLNWTAVSGATSYRLQRSQSNGSGFAYLATNTTTSFADSNVVNGATYYYLVSAANLGGEGPVSAETNATPAAGAHVPASLVWAGDGVSNHWDAQDATNLVWLNGGTPAAFYAGDSVAFDDSGSESPAVDLAVAVAPAGVEVNTTNAYTFTGVGGITGTGGLQKNGSGLLTIVNTNDFTGPLVVNAGTLQIGNGGAAGQLSGTILLSGGNLSLNRSDAFALNSVLAGGSTNSAVTDNGAGSVATLTFADGTNLFASVINYSPGTLILTGSASSTNFAPINSGSGNAVGTLQINGGTFDSTSAGERNFKGGLTLNGGNFVVSGNRFSLQTSGQALNINGGSLRVTGQANYGLRLGNSVGNDGSQAGYASVTAVQTNGIVTILRGGATTCFSLGGNSGTAGQAAAYTLAGGELDVLGGASDGALIIGADTNGYSVTTFALSGGKLVVTGAGKNGIYGAQTNGNANQLFAWTGGTLVAAQINATSLRDQTGDVPGTLVNAGGVLAPGDLGTPGATVIQGNYACSNAATLAVDIGGTNPATAFQNGPTNYDIASVTNNASLAGGLNVSLVNGFVPVATDSFTILTCGGALSGAFANLVGGRVAVANYPGGSFQVVTTATSVVLTNFQTPVAAFAASVTNGTAPLTVDFSDISSGLITSRVWDFGDGTVTNTADTAVAHTYTAAGTNPVTLTVSGNGATNSAGGFIWVAFSSQSLEISQPPVISHFYLSGTNLVITGTNGVTGADYLVLTTTNLATPVTNWTILSTNQFGPGGSVNFTSPMDPASPRSFYRLRSN